MRHSIIGLGGAFALTSALFTTASAQERGTGYLAEPVPAPSNALELKVGTGYTQGFGNAAPGRGLSDMSGAGVGASADVDYRYNKHWSFGVEGQYQELSAEQNSSARGLAANLGATYHFDPSFRGDPWVRLGTGYRWLWENNPTATPGATAVRYGLEALALKVGYDVRVSEDVALSPVVGADLNAFLWEDTSSTNNHALTTAQVATFVYAGVQGRFDIGGRRGEPVALTAATVPAPEPPPPAVPAPVVETKPVAPSIAVSEDIFQQCQMSLDSTDKAPKFEFDQAELLPADLGVLRQIGECFTTGPMKGFGMVLVGRADPRGSIEYNQALGMKRATSVASYLQELGVGANQMVPRSRGKLDAVGHDEASWAVDRRVDIVLQ